MRIVKGIAFLCLFTAGCSGGKTDSAKPEEPGIPIEKIEEIEGWIRLKSISGAAAQKLDVASTAAEVKLTNGANSFALPAKAYRTSTKEDYAEIELGTKLQTTAPPQTVGPAIFDKATLPSRVADHCAGKGSINVPVWYGCGPVACEGTGEVIAVACGGWTAANGPK
jgi:hypothetical protein